MIYQYNKLENKCRDKVNDKYKIKLMYRNWYKIRK